MISRFKNAKSKYGNRITVVDNIKFDSKKDMLSYIVDNTPFKNNKKNVIFSGNKHSLA